MLIGSPMDGERAQSYIIEGYIEKTSDIWPREDKVWGEW